MPSPTPHRLPNLAELLVLAPNYENFATMTAERVRLLISGYPTAV